MVSAIDVDGMQIGLHSGAQFVVRWNNTDVPVNAHHEHKGVFVAEIQKSDREKLGVYALEVELKNGLNESTGKTVKSCLLKTTTVAVTEAQVCTFAGIIKSCVDHHDRVLIIMIICRSSWSCIGHHDHLLTIMIMRWSS